MYGCERVTDEWNLANAIDGGHVHMCGGGGVVVAAVECGGGGRCGHGGG